MKPLKYLYAMFEILSFKVPLKFLERAKNPNLITD